MENEELLRKIEELSNRVVQLEDVINNHTHSGEDGSNSFFANSVVLNKGSKFQTGLFSLEEFSGIASDGAELNRSFLITGPQAGGVGVTNFSKDGTQLTIEHQPGTNKSTNQTFFYGFRSPLFFSGDGGSVTSGGSTLTQSKYEFEINELAGALVLAYDSSTSNVQFDVYTITSNTASNISIGSNNWTFTDSNCQFSIIVPVYFGAADYPWRRLYTMDGSGGGVRFGPGDTNGGQNGLLYMDGSDLKWRQPDGTVTTVTVT